MMPSRPCTRASAASTSSMRWKYAVSSNTARIASLPYSVPRIGPSAGLIGISDVQENGLDVRTVRRPLQADIQAPDRRSIRLRDQRGAALRLFDRRQQRVGLVQRLTLEIGPGDQVVHQPARQYANRQVRRLQRIAE